MAATGATRRRLLGRVALLVHDVGRDAVADVDPRHERAVAGASAVLVLADLAVSRIRRPGEIQQALGITTGGVANLLGRLDGAGLVERRTGGSDDGRAVLVALTGAGRAVARDLAAALVRNVGRSATALAELVDLLEHLDARRTGPAGEAPARAVVPRSLGEMSVALEGALVDDATDSTGGLVLLTVAAVGPCRPRFLADRLGLSTAGVAAAVDRLEHDGRVRRSRAGRRDDHRAVLVALTPAGTAAVAEIAGRVDTITDRLLGAATALAGVVAAGRR